MITSKELINLAEKRGFKLTYEQLKEAMRADRIYFKTRKGPEGLPIYAYLTTLDVCVLQERLRIPFNQVPKRHV